MNPEISNYNNTLEPAHRDLCNHLAVQIQQHLPEAEARVWHRHPVWFLDGNPIVGYSKEKPGIRLMFWSGRSFDEPGLNVVGGKFQDASVFFRHVKDIDVEAVQRWLEKGRTIQWDYKNIVRRKGLLERVAR
jgi:hypothetical protein